MAHGLLFWWWQGKSLAPELGGWMKNTQPNSEHGPMQPQKAPVQTIALLIKHPHQLDDARRCAATFMAGGARISFVCLCGSPVEKGRWNIQSLLDTEAECHTDDAAFAKRYGIHLLTPALLGPYLKSMDWVIPF